MNECPVLESDDGALNVALWVATSPEGECNLS